MLWLSIFKEDVNKPDHGGTRFPADSIKSVKKSPERIFQRNMYFSYDFKQHKLQIDAREVFARNWGAYPVGNNRVWEFLLSLSQPEVR